MAEIWYLQAGYQRRENLTFSPLMQLFGAWVKNRKFYRLGSDLDRICPRSQDQETYPHCGVLLQSHSNSWTPPTGSTKKKSSERVMHLIRKTSQEVKKQTAWAAWDAHIPRYWRDWVQPPALFTGRSVGLSMGDFFRQIPQSCQRCEGKMIQWSL